MIFLTTNISIFNVFTFFHWSDRLRLTQTETGTVTGSEIETVTGTEIGTETENYLLLAS